MKLIYNEHLNPRPYLTAPYVKFHIQNPCDVTGVAMCGGIYPPERYAVFSPDFVHRMDEKNQCQCCIKEYQDNQKKINSDQLYLYSLLHG